MKIHTQENCLEVTAREKQQGDGHVTWLCACAGLVTQTLFMWKNNTGQLEMQDNLTEAMTQSVKGLLCKHETLSLMSRPRLKSPAWWHLQSQHQGDTDRKIWGIHWLASLAYGGSFRLVRGPASTNKRGTAVEDPPKLIMGLHTDTHTSVHTRICTDV